MATSPFAGGERVRAARLPRGLPKRFLLHFQRNPLRRKEPDFFHGWRSNVKAQAGRKRETCSGAVGTGSGLSDRWGSDESDPSKGGHCARMPQFYLLRNCSTPRLQSSVARAIAFK